MQVAVFGSLAVDAVQHHTAAAEQGFDNRADNLASLFDGVFRAAAQGLVKRLDLLAGLDELAVHLGQAFAQYLELFCAGLAGLLLRAERWRCYGLGRNRGRSGVQRRAIAARRGIAPALQAQGAQRLDLPFILDLEVAEGKIVLPPGQFELDIQADTELIGGYIGGGCWHAGIGNNGYWLSV